MSFAVVMDTIEPRVQRDRIVSLVDGRHWDTLNTTAYIDGITRTGMLMPLYKDAALWAANTTGLYYRLHKTDYTFDIPPFEAVGTPPPYPDGTPTDRTKWNEHHHPYNGNVYMQAQGVHDRAITNAKYPKNRPFLLSWFSYNAGQSTVVQIECGWLSERMFIGLRLWTDGKCEIFKNGVQVGEGNIFERHVTTQTVYGHERDSYNFKAKHSRGDARQMPSQVVELMLIPCRRRDLLLLGNQGGGFRFTFEDLDPADPDNTITPKDARFFWQVPVGQPSVLLAPLNFKTSGDLISEIRTTRLAAGSTESPTLTGYSDQPGYGSGSFAVSLLTPDMSGPFIPDGHLNQVRVKAALSGDGSSTPFVYGASAVYDAITADTVGADSNVTAYVTEASLSVPENPADVSFKFTVHSPDTLGATVSQITSVSNRPVVCSISSIAFLTGRNKVSGAHYESNDRASRLMHEVRDRCSAMEEYRFKDVTPYNGLEMATAMTSIVQLPGYPIEEIDIPLFGFALPTDGPASEGEWSLIPEVGDKSLDWFVKLWETYARHTQWGWVPTAGGPVFQVRTLDELEQSASQVTLYPTIAEARDAGYSEAEAAYWVYRSFEPTPVPCEANDIWVTGRDPKTGKPFQTHFADTASQDPTLPPSSRPGNWLGEPREFAWIDTSITTLDAAAWVAATLARRLTARRFIIPFESFFLFRPDGAPVWRGDKVTLSGVGEVRITAFSGKFELEAAPYWRPFKYTGEVVYTPSV